jgi:hypothetical protein
MFKREAAVGQFDRSLPADGERIIENRIPEPTFF